MQIYIIIYIIVVLMKYYYDDFCIRSAILLTLGGAVSDEPSVTPYLSYSGMLYKVCCREHMLASCTNLFLPWMYFNGYVNACCF